MGDAPLLFEEHEFEVSENEHVVLLPCRVLLSVSHSIGENV